MANECSLEINPAFRVHKVQEVISDLWKASTSAEWGESVACLITLLKIADHDFFNELIFLIDVAAERQSMAHRKEMAEVTV